MELMSGEFAKSAEGEKKKHYNAVNATRQPVLAEKQRQKDRQKAGLVLNNYEYFMDM
jgi:hypothetical protein